MGRHPKEGLDYFSVDCQFSDKVKLIEAEFHLIGLGILIHLWQKIYGGKGYYTEWSDDVALVFASECGVGVNVVKEVISASLRRGLFDRQMYNQYQILTSEGIQERYAEATQRRALQKIDGRYLLVSMPSNWVNVDNNSIDVDKNAKNDDRNTQSKVKYSRVKYINNAPTRASAPAYACVENPDFEAVYAAYPRKDMKEEAQKVFERINPSFEEYNQMFDAILVQEKSEAWTEQNGRFIPNLPKWLESRQWANTPIVKAAKEFNYMDNISEKKHRTSYRKDAAKTE